MLLGKADILFGEFISGIVLIGEIGGQAEEKASEYLRNNNRVCKKVIIIYFKDYKIKSDHITFRGVQC